WHHASHAAGKGVSNLGADGISRLANDADHRPRATDTRHETESSSRGSVHPICWATVSWSDLLCCGIRANRIPLRMLVHISHPVVVSCHHRVRRIAKRAD